MIEVAAEARSVPEALDLLAALPFDVLFVDINLPGESGIAVAESTSRLRPRPYMIFVTAHEEFALQAFEVAANDYLMNTSAAVALRPGDGLSAGAFPRGRSQSGYVTPGPHRSVPGAPHRRYHPAAAMEDVVAFEAERQYCGL